MKDEGGDCALLTAPPPEPALSAPAKLGQTKGAARNDSAKWRVVMLGMILVVALLAGCGGLLEVDIERTPTPDVAPAATIDALRSENAQLAARVAAQVTPTPAPPRLGRVAYVQGGDIWIRALPTGVSLRLTTDGRNREPRWSPSGQWLAFRKDRSVTIEQEIPCEVPRSRSPACTESVTVLQKQVWIVESDGSGAYALNQGQPVEAYAWSPTRDRLAFIADNVLYTLNANGSDVSFVTKPAAEGEPLRRLSRLAWSPDGQWLAYDVKILPSARSPAYQGLWQVSADGRTRVELYNGGVPTKTEAVLAGWSALGQRVLFWQGDAESNPTDGAPLWAVPAQEQAGGAAPVRLATEVVLLHTDFVVPLALGTGPDAWDAMAVVTGAGRNTWKDKRIEVGGQPLTPKTLAAVSPAWSPVSGRIAFVAMPNRTDLGLGGATAQELLLRRIWVVGLASGAPPQQLTDTFGFRDERPLWSTDGNYILFVRMDSKGRVSLWVMGADGSNLRQVVDELTPAPDPLGFYGRVDWDALYDWWRGT